MIKVFGMALLIGSLSLFMTSTASADNSCDTDFNQDGVTDEADFEILKDHIGATEDLDGYSAAVDLTDDGQIDLADLNAFLNCN